MVEIEAQQSTGEDERSIGGQPDRDGTAAVRRVEGVRSTASFLGHPIHPMVVPFPIALLSSAVATDLAYVLNGRRFWASASVWLTWAGAASALAAAVFGLIDFVTIGKARAHRAGWIHAGGNALALVLALVSGRIRTRDVTGAVVPAGIALSGLIAGILTITGWYGGELSYRHGIGVVGHEPGEGD